MPVQIVKSSVKQSMPAEVINSDVNECQHVHQKEVPIYGSLASVTYHLWYCGDCGWFRVTHHSQLLFEYPAIPLPPLPPYGTTSREV